MTTHHSSQASTLDRLVAAYADPIVDPSTAAWRRLLADDGLNSKRIVVVEFVRLVPDAGAADNYDAFVDALAPAVATAGGEMLSVNDTLIPGIEGLEGYEGGVSWIAAFPSIWTYVDALLDARVIATAPKRRSAVAEAQVLLGADLLPDAARRLPPNEPASAFPSDRTVGRSCEELVGELLSAYPSGGADPTRRTLEWIVTLEGFREQRVHYINLYRFNGEPGGGVAALGEYNAKATPAVLAHGARPKALVDVAHHLVGPVAWDRFVFVSWPSLAVFTDLRLDPVYIEAQKSRVVSAEEYGNLITIARADRRGGAGGVFVSADEIPVAHTPTGGWHGEMPPPVLAGCTEPLAPGAPDLRGVWRVYSVEQDGKPITDHALNRHVERIEQCGDRVVITGEPVIHDMRVDGTLERGVNDVAAANLSPIQVAALFTDGRLDLHPFGVVAGRAPLVTRELVDGELVWHYGPFKVKLRRG